MYFSSSEVLNTVWLDPVFNLKLFFLIAHLKTVRSLIGTPALPLLNPSTCSASARFVRYSPHSPPPTSHHHAHLTYTPHTLHIHAPHFTLSPHTIHTPYTIHTHSPHITYSPPSSHIHSPYLTYSRPSQTLPTPHTKSLPRLLTC